jgi:hypothetical protein
MLSKDQQPENLEEMCGKTRASICKNPVYMMKSQKKVEKERQKQPEILCGHR